MYKKIVTLITMFVLIVISSFLVDLFIMSSIYTSLDGLSISIAHQIALKGNIDEDIIQFVHDYDEKIIISSNNDKPLEFGSIYVFKLSKKYQPIIYKIEEVTISINRSTVIGYLS